MEAFTSGKPREKPGCRQAIGDISARESEGDGATVRVGQRVDVRRASAVRATDGLIFLHPFTAARRTMRRDSGGVDENPDRRTAFLRERVEQVHPDSLRGPADIEIVESFLRPVFQRASIQRRPDLST